MINKTMLITGGAQGIGKAIAQRFLSDGYSVIVFDIKKPHYDVEYYKVDIRKENEIQKAFENIAKLDVLVNNAGIYFWSPVENTTNDQLEKIIDVNLKGTYLMSKHALPLLRQNKGTIINISSGLGQAPEPESPAYCATKAAINMLTKCMAQQYAAQGIRINAILPGPIDTPMLREAFKTNEELEQYQSSNPMKKIGKPESIASMASYLASDDASYITGGLFAVDGGESSSSLYSKQ